MTVSIVGYTNAGKSTLMNALTKSDVLAEDMLFATLDTRTRRWHLPKWGPVLLSDTVGFIRDLPHSLIASFKATLEETRQADLLLHVADASNPNVMDQIRSVYDVLKEIGIEEKDTLLVLNKVDQIEKPYKANTKMPSASARKQKPDSTNFIKSSAMRSVDRFKMLILRWTLATGNFWRSWLPRAKSFRRSLQMSVCGFTAVFRKSIWAALILMTQLSRLITRPAGSNRTKKSKETANENAFRGSVKTRSEVEQKLVPRLRLGTHYRQGSCLA
jgi:GTP-binding protein EngB required for normal cell division